MYKTVLTQMSSPPSGFYSPTKTEPFVSKSEPEKIPGTTIFTDFPGASCLQLTLLPSGS